MSRTMAAAAATLMLAASSGAETETIFGRWCDRMVPSVPEMYAIIAIVAESDGTMVVRWDFSDGSGVEFDLREASGGVFHKVDSQHGDRYRISPRTGDLQLLDYAGLIRMARRLENTPTAGECP